MKNSHIQNIAEYMNCDLKPWDRDSVSLEEVISKMKNDGFIIKNESNEDIVTYKIFDANDKWLCQAVWRRNEESIVSAFDVLYILVARFITWSILKK